MSQLPADIGACATEVLRRVKALTGSQQALWHLAHDNEPLKTELLRLKAELMCITGEAAKMQCYVAAAKMCGLVESPTRAQDLELHPSHDGQRELMLESLHRVNDHTHDEEVEA